MTDREQIDLLVEKYGALRQEMAKVIVGQTEAVDSLLLSVFTGGHCLLLGVPGLAKTLMVNTLAQTLGLTFSRIQFTPDLMPSDITGSEILDQNRNFKFIQGPVFSNIILADEINRTPPKTQAALLEAMQEKKVTVSGSSYALPNPFFVLATQNPIEQEGTYPLPEAQLDRFMFNVRLDYPSFEEEYAVRLVTSTRSQNKYISWGAGPRASQYLIMGARCYAAMHGKYSPDAEDVRAVAFNVLRHRIVRNYYAEAEGISTDQIINELLK